MSTTFSPIARDTRAYMAWLDAQPQTDAGRKAGTLGYDVGGFRLPSHTRQVNEAWLDEYRGWVYGGGFGWQIGRASCRERVSLNV